jgi:zinc protease
MKNILKNPKSVSKSSVLLANLLLTGGLVACQSSSGVVASKSRESLRPFQEKTLPNGLKLLFFEDKTLPYISMQMMLKTGASQDPEGKSGLAQMVSSLLQKGTTNRTAPVLAQELGSMAADFDTAVEEDYIMVSIGTLSSFQGRVAQIFAELVLEPSFDEKEIDRLKQQFVSSILRRTDDAGGFADEVFEKNLFGSHPYSRPVYGSVVDLKSIRKKHITQFYLRHFRPGNAILSVVGKVDDATLASIEKSFGTWESREATERKMTTPDAPTEGSMLLVDKPGLAQAQIRLGQVSIRRNHPDFQALRLANLILGGHMESRLAGTIRGKLGLTYSIASDFSPLFESGSWAIRTSTRPEKFGEALRETQKLLATFAKDGVTEAELTLAKNMIIGRFPQAVETAEKLSQQLMILRRYGIPDEYLTRFTENISAIRLADVNAAIAKHFQPSTMKVVVMADGAKVRSQLSEFGKVDRKPYNDYQ